MKVINQEIFKEFKISRTMRTNLYNCSYTSTNEDTLNNLRAEQTKHYNKYIFLKRLGKAFDKLEEQENEEN